MQPIKVTHEEFARLKSEYKDEVVLVYPKEEMEYYDNERFLREEAKFWGYNKH